MLTGLTTVAVMSVGLAAPSRVQGATTEAAVIPSGVQQVEAAPSVVVQMIPTPGAAGLIALGGVALLRRRREPR